MHDDDRDDCDEPWLPFLLAAGSSLLLGYIVGRGSYAKDVVRAMRLIEQSPVPIEVGVPVLG